MDVKKLFRILVMGGAVLGTAAATRSVANESQGAKKHDKSGKNQKDATPDAGQVEAKDDQGGGVKGW
jgi:hypothetical protein